MVPAFTQLDSILATHATCILFPFLTDAC